VTVIYISHRLAEVQTIADRVVVLRDGRNAGELPRARIARDAMVRLMVGRELSQQFPHSPHSPGPVVLRAGALRTRRYPQHAVNLELRAGEIVGLAGLVGSGRSELLRTIFGIDSPLDGEIHVCGHSLPARSADQAIDAGVALVPEDRKQQGLIIEMNVRENLSLASLA